MRGRSMRRGTGFPVRELTPFRGPCTLYLKRTIRMSEDREYRVHIGHSDAYRLYLNGVLVSERTGVEKTARPRTCISFRCA